MTAAVTFQFGTMIPQAMSHLSLDYVQVPVTATQAGTSYNPTADTVQFAFPALTYPVTSPSVWFSGSWVTFPGPAYWAQCLIGPANGGASLAIGTYEVWVKVTDSPEVPVFQPCTLEITA